MDEIRAPEGGTIVEVPVGEGQMVAEEDEIVRLRTRDGNDLVVITAVPGVVRELYVTRGAVVVAGDPLAAIDES